MAKSAGGDGGNEPTTPNGLSLPAQLRDATRTVLWLAGVAALLFVPAGTVRWPGAWVFLVETSGLGLATELWLARHDPELLAQRRSSLVQTGQAGWDKVLMAIVPVLWLAWLPLMALDAVRFQASYVPVWVQVFGGLALAVSFFLVYLTYRENSYAAPVVKIQKERGHKVVTTGPYRYVRHPIYASGILSYLGTPLLLGSWYGLIMVPVLTALLGIRAVMEERMLEAELKGYREYVARVRYRLIPMIW
jgi:protein-S-isoprenylcysteine O-methyltransferase Ste14